MTQNQLKQTKMHNRGVHRLMQCKQKTILNNYIAWFNSATPNFSNFYFSKCQINSMAFFFCKQKNIGFKNTICDKIANNKKYKQKK